MCQVNVLQAKTELSRLISLLENKSEDEIVIARNGKPVARIVPWNGKSAENRIGVAKGKFTVPDDFDSMDDMVAALFTGSAP
ncbi:MAG: prevent-host-death protein [Spirochaetes bacterium GWB1_59_5]|nr:MAG: prevent-host-death protein [Spirochaetes bacterium GWB1_59_5]